jgi:hypothetical protein
MSATFSFAQQTSLGRAPEGIKMPSSISNDNPTNANNRGFVYLSTTTHQMAKQFMGNTTLTNIGAPQTYGFPGAFAYKSGTIYVNDQLAPYGLYTLDTNTGAKTLVVNITGITLTNLTGITWDGTQMWGVQSSITASQIGTINLTTGVFTPVGTASTACAGAIQLNAAPNGSLWSVDIVADALFKWDKTTGVATNKGALGVNANYGQDGHFDMSDGKYYWASYTTGPELRIIDTTNGTSTVVGTYSGQMSCLAVVAESGPSITHTPLPNTQNVTGPYVANATITPSGTATLTGAKVYWSRNNVVLTDSITMTNSGSNYSGSIPGNGTSATYRYQIRAYQNDGKMGQTGVNTFVVSGTDTSKPVITHTAIGSTPKSTWPVAVTATVTDNIGIDSVWVRWYKSTAPSTVKQFKILNTTGNTYSALFNSVNADVNIGDVINYRIIAQDNSAQHLKDSTALNNFTIIALVTACIGTGTTSSNYPFTTYWMDGRTQMLFTAAELNAQGLIANHNITKVGFNVLTRDPAVMSGFTVKFQHTTATSLTGFVTTGTWHTGFTGSYTVPGTGQQNIDMTSPYFLYNGTSNLLVEICYDNSAYTQYSTVASTAATGMTWGYYTDNAAGCTMTGGTTQAPRPNTCFTATPGVGITPIGNTLPTVYSLSQNYPNPFNPVTKINFALPKQGFVTLKIYDVLGREVRTLVNEVKSAGTFAVDFNASEFSSGVYFYKLEADGFSDIKRMMLIK